jgi:hypothetical protein
MCKLITYQAKLILVRQSKILEYFTDKDVAGLRDAYLPGGAIDAD